MQNIIEDTDMQIRSFSDTQILLEFDMQILEDNPL